MIVAYVSGHGFGHSTRVAEVLAAVRAVSPETPLGVVTSAPESLYRAAIPGPFLFRSRQCDVGLSQKGALVIDEEGTLSAWREFQKGQAARIAEEVEWLRSVGARMVMGDVPPLAFEAAAGAGLPGIALANFSWDWIYRHLARRHPGFHEPADIAARAYGKASVLLQLPFAGDLSAFPRREEIPLVARKPAMSWERARSLLEEKEGPLVLISFGGLGLPGFDPTVLAGLEPFRFLTSDAWPAPPSNVRVVDVSELASRGLGYIDLVAAADAVVTKPGYGIVSDAIGARTRMVYTERGDFPEYPILVEQMARWLPCRYVSNSDLLKGRLDAPLHQVLADPYPPAPDLGGAARAAERLLAIGRP